MSSISGGRQSSLIIEIIGSTFSSLLVPVFGSSDRPETAEPVEDQGPECFAKGHLKLSHMLRPFEPHISRPLNTK